MPITRSEAAKISKASKATRIISPAAMQAAVKVAEKSPKEGDKDYLPRVIISSQQKTTLIVLHIVDGRRHEVAVTVMGVVEPGMEVEYVYDGKLFTAHLKHKLGDAHRIMYAGLFDSKWLSVWTTK